MVQFPRRHGLGYMSRAKTHSPGTFASGGIGKSLYSQAGYSRNGDGCWLFRSVRFPTEDASIRSSSRSGVGAVAPTTLSTTRPVKAAKSKPRKHILGLAGVRIARGRREP